MIKIRLSENERKYLIDILMSRDLNLGDDINDLEKKINDESEIDIENPTKEQIKDHDKRIKRLNNELKDLKEADKINLNILRGLN